MNPACEKSAQASRAPGRSSADVGMDAARLKKQCSSGRAERRAEQKEKSENMIPYDDSGFTEAIDTTLKPWLEKHVSGGQFESFDKTKIQYYQAVRPDAKAVIVMLHGFTEFFGKYHETAYDFWENGYTVYFIELRGHGGSGRSVEDPDVVDVEDFSEYVEDVKCLLDKVVLPGTPGLRLRSDIGRKRPARREEDNSVNLLLYAHSMGGCVGGLFLERYPEYFCAAVLSSPMLRMAFGDLPAWQVKLLVLASKVRGWKEELMPGMNHFDPDAPDFDGSGTLSQARFDYQFNIRKDPANGGIYTMSAATWNWGRAAMKATQDFAQDMGQIRVPVLVCQSGRDAFVDNEGQNEFAAAAKHVKLVRFPEAKHEIYASDPESMKQYYRELFRFFRRAQEL